MTWLFWVLSLSIHVIQWKVWGCGRMCVCVIAFNQGATVCNTTTRMHPEFRNQGLSLVSGWDQNMDFHNQKLHKIALTILSPWHVCVCVFFQEGWGGGTVESNGMVVGGCGVCVCGGKIVADYERGNGGRDGCRIEGITGDAIMCLFLPMTTIYHIW